MGKKTGNDEGTIASRAIASMTDALRVKKANREVHRLVTDYELADDVLAIGKKLNALVMRADRHSDEVPEALAEEIEQAKAELELAQAALEDGTLVVWFQALGGQEMEDLMADHLPTRDQQDELRRQLLSQGLPANERLQYNSDTFPPAIISACAVDPEISYDEAVAFWNSENISRGERGKMLEAAYRVNDIVR